MADIVDDIKARLSINDLIAQYVPLKKAGVNYKACCPFHSEKTPSFVVSPEKQIFHCFGCSKGGDIFTFVQEYEGVGFPEALQILADKAGVKIDNIQKYYKKGDKSEKDDYFKAHGLACEFFEKKLKDTKEGKKVMEYLHKRGITDETIKEFRIGFAPDSFEDLHQLLLKKGIKKEILLKSGFVTSKGVGTNEVYDKFRARLMFPIFDYLGRICGFGGRALKKDQMPKYLNSPENKIYSKSKVLYGLSHAKQAIKEKDSVIVVEGYFDVILPYQSGVQNVVASSGTALSNDQIRLIKRLTKNITTCFDNDEAGFDATKRAYVLCQNEDMAVKTIEDLGAKDPADLIVKEKKDFASVAEGAKDFISFYIDKLVKENDVTTYDGRRKVLGEILPIYKKMSPSAKDFYVPEFAGKINISEKAFYDEINNFQLPADHPAREYETADTGKKIDVQDIVLSLLLKNPSLMKKAEDIIDKNFFESEKENIYKALRDQYNSARSELYEWNRDKGFLAEVKEKIDILLLYAEESYHGFSEEILTLELEKLVDRMVKNRKTNKLNNIQNKIAEAEEEGDKEKLKALLKEQQTLLSEQNH